MLLSDGWDIWKVPVEGGAAVNLTVNGKKDKIRYRARFRLDPEEKGIDLTAPVYVPALRRVDQEGRHRRDRARQARHPHAAMGRRRLSAS